VIPKASITAWRSTAPWPEDWQVEQDLILSRALIDIYKNPVVANNAAFRGGTALHKLFFKPPGRYSEDIDLVQKSAGPIGPLIDAIRHSLDSWLGNPRWKVGNGRFTLYYRVETTIAPVVRIRLKIEINTREHFSVHGYFSRRLDVSNTWFSGTADVTTYTLPELLGTKLRALYQRKKGRDLFDLEQSLDHPEFDISLMLQSFSQYMAFGNANVSLRQLEENVSAKVRDPVFHSDVLPLLRTGVEHNSEESWKRLHSLIVTHM